MTATAELRSTRKLAPASSERIVSPEQTVARARSIAFQKGVTRVSDITGLDRIGIPVFSAVVPKSDDIMTVYNGKGITPVDALAGSLMEAIERQTALNSDFEIVEGSYNHLRAQPTAIIDPKSFNRRLCTAYAPDKPYWWVHGHDLIHDEPVLLPAALVAYGPRYSSAGSPFQTYSSDGLASGNCFEEAVCHALCELVERDAWTLAELKSHWLPRARMEAVLGSAAERLCLDDYNACPLIDLTSADDSIQELLRKFRQAGLSPVVRDITSDFEVSCVVASVADDYLTGFPQAHGGLGAHPNARIAVIRALTELAQSRVVDIQGVREDILPADAQPKFHERNSQRMKRLDHRSWLLRAEGQTREFADMSSSERHDIRDDIRSIVDAMAGQGIERVVVVDLHEPDGFSVVRVVIPGLEFWMVDGGRLGARAVRFWKSLASAA